SSKNAYGEWNDGTAEPLVNGLHAEYYSNVNLAGSPALERVDLLVDFDWYHYSPEPSLIGTNFSARWTGSFTPDVSVLGILDLNTDDGARYNFTLNFKSCSL